MRSVNHVLRTAVRCVRSAPLALAALLPASAVLAADLRPSYVEMPAAPVARDWSGFYVGLQGGYDFGRDHLREYFTNGMAYTGLEWEGARRGFVGGGHVGYNRQFGSIVLGVEADFEGANTKWNFVDEVQNIGIGGGKTNWQGSVRGRIGYAFDRFMIYGTGGYSFANIGYTYTNRMTNISETNTELRDGWTVGGGIEAALSHNMTARLEYRYANYGKSLFDSLTSFPGLTGEQQPRSSTVRGGVSFRF